MRSSTGWTPSATAAANAADVLRAWGKLGYPRRAKRLHECAIAIAAEHGDEVPDDVETLLTLPGIGTYIWLDNVMWPSGGAPSWSRDYVDDAFNSNHVDSVHFLFADGSVHFIKDNINPVPYRALATRALGEVVSADSY